MYVAVKGGEKAIEQSYLALARKRRGDPGLPELTLTGHELARAGFTANTLFRIVGLEVLTLLIIVGS